MDFINKMAEKMQFIQCENDELERRLKTVAKNIQTLGIEQPCECLFTEGTCNYPIDDCYNCPIHTWSGYKPTTTAEMSRGSTIHIDRVDTLNL